MLTLTELTIPLGPGITLRLADGSTVRLCWKYEPGCKDEVRLGVEAPRHVDVVRDEVEWRYPGRPIGDAKPVRLTGWRAVKLTKAGKIKEGRPSCSS